jgi:hypothetical protein
VKRLFGVIGGVLGGLLALCVVYVAIVVAFSDMRFRSVDEDRETRKNETILRSVPVFPGARFGGSYSTGTRYGNGWPEGGGPYTSFSTSHEYKIAP